MLLTPETIMKWRDPTVILDYNAAATVMQLMAQCGGDTHRMALQMSIQVNRDLVAQGMKANVGQVRALVKRVNTSLLVKLQKLMPEEEFEALAVEYALRAILSSCGGAVSIPHNMEDQMVFGLFRDAVGDEFRKVHRACQNMHIHTVAVTVPGEGESRSCTCATCGVSVPITLTEAELASDAPGAVIGG